MKKTKRIGGVSWIIILFCILIPSIIYANGGDILSRFQIYGTVQEIYDNNIYLAPSNKQDDFITNVSLGVRFSTLPISETTREFQQTSSAEEAEFGINLDFLPAYIFYAKQTNNNYLSLFGNLNTWYTWNRSLTFRVKDYLIRSEEPIEQSYVAGALPNEILLGSQRGRPIYLRNVAQPSLEYRFGKEDVISINYLNNIYRNQRDEIFEDSTEQQITPKLTYWFDIRNGITMEYFLDLGRFQRSPDMTGNLGRGRYTYRFNPNTSVFGEFIFLKRSFKPQTVNNINYNVYKPTLGFDYAFSHTLSISTQFGYFWETQKEGSGQNGPAYNIVLTQRGQRTIYTLGVKGGYTEDYFTAENLGFAKYHQAIGSITHQLTQKATVILSGRYQRPKYNSGRLDNIWGVGTGVSYRILRWLTPALDFSYTENHSNIKINNYTDFQGGFKITATY